MAELIEYARMATHVYKVANIENQISVPDGWSSIDWQPDQFWNMGFSAGAFQKGDEIVIAYTGTNDAGDMLNWSIGMGSPASQIVEAVNYYLEIKAAHPEATKITFTGHSLGGGLASLMAVFFDLKATTFDEAPFQLAALNLTVIAEVGVLLATRLANEPAFNAYAASAGLLALSREYNVTHYAIEGEVLGYPRLSPTTLVGADHVVEKGNSTAGVVQLHSMDLLTAALASPNFHEVMQKLPSLVERIMDANLFGADRESEDKKDILRHLLRHQFGVDGVTQDNMLDRFGADLYALARFGPEAADSAIAKAMIEIGLQHYFQQSATQENFFTQLDGGVQFDLTKSLGDTDTALGSILGYEKLLEAARPMAPWEPASSYPQPWEALNTFTTNKVRWNVALGETGLQGSATGTLADLVLGGNEADHFDAGAGDDLLIGGAGMDNLRGGEGNDILYGGTDADNLEGNAGNDKLHGGDGNDMLRGGAGDDILVGGDGQDIYLLEANGGTDHIEDDSGVLIWNGQIVAGTFLKQGDSETYRYVGQEEITLDFAGGTATLTFADGTQAILSRQTSPGAFANNLFGINLVDVPNDPETTLTLQGDQAPADTDPGEAGMQYDVDELGNLIVEGAAAGRRDLLLDSPGNDHLQGLGGDDILTAHRGGHDWIEGGDGHDAIRGDGGDDLIEGGADADVLSGGAGNDRLYADTRIDPAHAIENGNTQTGTGQKADWLAGGDGDDLLIGNAGHDVLSGGGGADLLIGGAGDDYLLGDTDYLPASTEQVYFAETGWTVTPYGWDWTVTLQANGTYTFQTSADGAGDNVAGQADVIYAGNGNDVAWGGAGDDILFGEGGDDQLIGETGHDTLLGGNGDDKLWGNTGDDYLDGGADNDELDGGDGDDILVGGAGDDILHGGAGQDTYLYNKGDGKDTIVDAKADNNILRFGAGIKASDITLKLGSLMLDLGDGDEIHIAGFDQNKAMSSSSIATFAFEDGTVLGTYESRCWRDGGWKGNAVNDEQWRVVA